jgi:CelD/BcsL family acetyltransferase involved in cellulose biosynthesis
MLAFMKTGITPRCSFLIDPDEEPTAVFDGLWRIDGWDVAEFKSLVRDDPLTRRFLDHVKSRGVCVVEPGSGSPYQTLPADWEQFEKTRSKGFRKRFRNSNNRCRKADGFELVKIETAAALDEVFDELLEVSRNSWKADGGTDLVTQSGMAEFFRAFARATEDEGLWVVYLMRLEGRAVAFDYYLRHRGRLVGLRWEYDQQYGYYMPGVVVHVAALKDLLASGGVEYDLAGTDTDFKSGLVDSLREHVDVTFGHAGTKSRLLITLKDTLVRSRQAGLLPGGR